MPFGTLSSSQRLGLSNVTVPNAASFGETVLRLPPGFLVYQQQMVHSTVWRHGPGSAAGEWCGNVDDEKFHEKTMRQVSAHDTVFARRNLSVTPQYAFGWHRANSYNQIYYAGNEPNAYSTLSTRNGIQPCDPANDCWDPRDRIIDAGIAGCFPNPDTQFWETALPGERGFGHACPSELDWKRIRPEALALVYLRIKREAESLGRGHVVLPPSAMHATLGSGTDATAVYWQTFYDGVHNGVSVGTCSEQGISVANLNVLHMHHYALKPETDSNGNLLFQPRASVGYSASIIRRGVDWYRSVYHPGTALPLDILLSETGPAWDNKGERKFAGGWPNFRDGLAWWNTWLCWLLRMGARDCNLLDWSSGAHTIHACIHEASIRPMATNSVPNGNRNQWYFNSDTWSTSYYSAQTIDLDGTREPEEPSLDVVGGGSSHIYQRSFSVSPISWDGRTWYTTPFGACFTVWSRVGALPVTGDLNTGWMSNTQAGVTGTASVSIPAGWSTVYFPIIKNTGTFPAANRFFVQWVRNDGAVHDRGILAMDDFEDSGVYSDHGYSQDVNMSMVYPVVCYSSYARTVKVQLSRNITGPEVWLGPPVVLPGVCSWFITQ